MINSKSWNKVERGVAVVSALLMAAFWMTLMRGGALAWALTAWGLWQAYESYRLERLDERETLITARAGYLSHKLTLAAGMLLLALSKSPADAQAALLTVILIGGVSEAVFRRLQGAQQAEPAPRWLWALMGAIFLVFAWGILSVFRNIAESFGMNMWQLGKLFYNGSPD